MIWVDPIEIILLGVIGAIVGSFLATLAIRWGQGESVIDGRSRCDHCATVLPHYNMIPVLSYVLLRGHCSSCGGMINARHVSMELLCSFIGMVAVVVAPGVDGYAGAVFGWLLVILALLDVEHFWLPDALVLPLGCAGLVTAALGVAPDAADRIMGVGVGLSLIGGVKIAYRFRTGRTGIGAGDVKLAGAIGAWIGAGNLPWVIIAASSLGLIWAAVLNHGAYRIRAHDRVPLGAFLSVGAWIIWLVESLI